MAFFLFSAAPFLFTFIRRSSAKQCFASFICGSDTKAFWTNTLIIHPKLSQTHMGTQPTIYTPNMWIKIHASNGLWVMRYKQTLGNIVFFFINILFHGKMLLLIYISLQQSTPETTLGHQGKRSDLGFAGNNVQTQPRSLALPLFHRPFTGSGFPSSCTHVVRRKQPSGHLQTHSFTQQENKNTHPAQKDQMK